MILANYNTKCAITELIFQSYISKPYSSLVNKRKWKIKSWKWYLSFGSYDKAFDKGLIGINQNYQVILSTGLKRKLNLVFIKLILERLKT
jgi:putative restriction endonuclease